MKYAHTPDLITSLKENEIFVFGSNLRGMHAGGAARTACQWGAVWGQGEGIQGKTYAIPTMFESAAEIAPYVDNFIAFARENPTLTFLVTPIGCGIAAFDAKEIATLFMQVVVEGLENVVLPKTFLKELEK